MKAAFAFFLALFVGLYIQAQRTLIHPKEDGIVRLRWATDANPARPLQTAMFSKMYPGTDVTVDPGLGGDQTKLIVQCATGTGPDIIDVYSQQQMVSLVDAGVLLDLTPYAKERGFGPEGTYPSLKEGLMVDGKQYRYPCNVWATCVIYNKAIFDDHGVPYPKDDWNYDDFIKAAQAIRDKPSKSGEKHMPVAHWNRVGFFNDLLVGYGGRFFSKDGFSSALDSPESLKAMRFYYDLMYKYKVLPTSSETAAMSAQGGWGSSGLTWFSSGKAAMIFIGRWYIIQLPNYPDLKGKLGATRLPRIGDRPSRGLTDARAAAINAKSPHWKESLKFLQYLASEEYGKVIVDGGDSLPPNPHIARNGQDLVNDIVPDPAFHQPFADAVKTAQPPDASPYIDANLAARWLGEMNDKIDNRVVTPEAGMKTLASEINKAIRVNLERRPDLQRRFAKQTGQPYTPDWWRTLQ